MNVSLEFYIENGEHCVYIGTDGGSGYKMSAKTKEELMKELAIFLVDNVDF